MPFIVCSEDYFSQSSNSCEIHSLVRLEELGAETKRGDEKNVTSALMHF